MKKILIIAAAVAATVGCTKSSLVYEENDQKIALAPIANTLTKGFGAMSVTYNEQESFKVWAEWIEGIEGTTWDVASTARAHYIQNVTFSKSGDTWTSVNPYYWPKTGSLLFAAVSPATLPAGTAALNYSLTAPYTRTLTVTDFVQGAYANTLSDSEQVDLMWVDIPATSTGKVASHPMTFKHALSWITFKASTDTDGLYTLTGLTIKKASADGQGVYNKGTFTSDGASASWVVDESTSAAEYALFAGSQDLAKTAASLIADNLLVLPQSTGTRLQLVIKFKQKGIDAVQTMTVAFPKVTWAMKTHYTYTLKFNAQGTTPGVDDLKITITPSVETWTDGGNSDIAAK